MNLHTYMQRHGMTDAELAARIGVTRASISRFRRGKVIPSLQTAVKIVEATRGKVTATELFNTPDVPSGRKAACRKNGRQK